MQKGPSPLEIERKFLIRYPKVSWLADCQGSRCAELTQTYLRSDGHGSRRVRSWTESGKTVWYETSKRMVTDITREEIEREISEEEYRQIAKEYPHEIIANREDAEPFRKKYIEGHIVLLEGENRLL